MVLVAFKIVDKNDCPFLEKKGGGGVIVLYLYYFLGKLSLLITRLYVRFIFFH